VSGTTGLDWTGSVSGTGTTKITGTSAGTYQAAVRAYTTVNGTTCYGNYGNNNNWVSAYINPPSTVGSRLGSCNCVSGLVECQGWCVNYCYTNASIYVGDGISVWVTRESILPSTQSSARQECYKLESPYGWTIPTTDQLKTLITHKAEMTDVRWESATEYWTNPCQRDANMVSGWGCTTVAPSTSNTLWRDSNDGRWYAKCVTPFP
jgi:hypothetical protein